VSLQSRLAALITQLGTDYKTLDAKINNTWVVVNHGSTAGTERPAGAEQVLWVGTVQPTNAQTNDFWVNK
jgi:hypothetical protein